MAASTSSSVLGHGDGSTLSPSAASSIAGSSTLYSGSSTTTHVPASFPNTSLSGTDHLRDIFNKRIRSLVYLKRSLQGQRPWLSTVQLDSNELASAFDNDRMHKRTLRYSLLGLSLSSILEIANPSDMARAIVSLINELDSYTDDNIVALTSGTGAANFGTQRPRMRSFFKSGKQTLKRSTAAQAISEFGAMDSNVGPASTFTATSSSEQSSYMMAPNIPFQLDFFQTFCTLCDMLTEIYYKMLSFLPKEAAEAGTSYGTFPRTASPPTPASGHYSGQEHDRTGSISQTMSAAGFGDGGEGNDKQPTSTAATSTVMSGMTQELLLKADAKIKKTMHAQVKDIDMLARQLIKDELSSLDPLMKDLGLDSVGLHSAFASSSSTAPTKSGSTVLGGLPSTSTSSLPFAFNNTVHSSNPSSNAGPTTSSNPSGTTSKLSSLPSHFRRPPKESIRTSQDSSSSTLHHGHHQFNLNAIPGVEGEAQSSAATGENAAAVSAGAGSGIGSLIRSRSGRLRRVMSGDRPSSSHGYGGTPTSESAVPVYPANDSTTKE